MAACSTSSRCEACARVRLGALACLWPSVASFVCTCGCAIAIRSAALVLTPSRPPLLCAQLLQLVVDQPNLSACDMRLISHIWEAFLRWTAKQFENEVGVRVLGMGEFCYRKDTIGDMEFLNPMFILNETFARSFKLHDRRPKVHVADKEAVDLDMQQIAGITTDLLGEVIGKEVVENGLRDLIEWIGKACSDPDQYGIVLIDFGFARLFCENRSLEFQFGATDGAPPATAGGKSVKSMGGSAKLGSSLPPIGKDADAMSVGGSSMLGRSRVKPDAPLQRPHRPHNRPKHSIHLVSKNEMLEMHAQQLQMREEVKQRMREEEASQHLEVLQRLRSEMVLDYSQRENRRDLMKVLAVQQKVQEDEKRQRDLVDRGVVGQEFWPFRTEEQVQDAIAATNKAQKAFLDQQLHEKHEKLAYMQREAEKRRELEQKQALAELKALEGEKTGRRPAPKGGKASVKGPTHGVEIALDDAFSRYEEYLHKRKEGIESSSSFVREQRYLSEQAEVLKSEEQRRRMAEMKAYLDRQVRDKAAAKAVQKDLQLKEPANRYISALPMGAEIDEEEETYVKMAIRHALDGQVERKHMSMEEEKVASLRAEQQVLGYVAQEMQEARYRAFSEKKEQAAALRSTWAKQQQLKLMEATLDRAEAA